MSLDSNSSKFQFVGQGWSFPPKFNKTSKGVEVREGNSDIRRRGINLCQNDE
jgi:hypothetical protein